MSARQVVYVAGHLLATPSEVAHSWRCSSPVIRTSLGPIIIPAEYAVGTAQHETDFALDEVDTEPSGFTSYGIYQLSKEEAREAGYPDADLLDLDQASEVFARISVTRVLAIVDAIVKRDDGSIAAALRGDLWFYLAMSHNMGLGAAIKSINGHGLDAAAWTVRNPQLAQAARYFNDVMTGGERWPEVR